MLKSKKQRILQKDDENEKSNFEQLIFEK